MKPTCRISWAGNIVMWSDLSFGPSINLKRWFTGFGELSFWGIQICISSSMRRSSFSSADHVRSIFKTFLIQCESKAG